MKCLILHNEEISEEDCKIVTVESYNEKWGKLLPKKCKRIAGWNWICKNCAYHKKPENAKKAKYFNY
ncbi:hypothetical protein [[Clostridium] fimetarium]|uniref:Uncharacterized protein n=1 Tax=[Clostridium] fimetarium TaxID=99656 RepID=A0A1I0PVQ6_9FIRM|nr:hypothetical protein [[Clostridium] fimetarium]SEW18443.1 hypothetical protein SAMN05421659_10643 [[Clostridium] fimetarium]